ncbi:MAG: potassium channel family protein [Desulfobacterales bacterium]|nr:potassium channel family protein [Desulfobacterales bacterium]
MLHIIKALIRTGLRHRGVTLVFAYLVLLLASSALIALVEPEGSDLTRPGQALWWSIVTSTTVGYGDIYPSSALGKIVAVLLPMFMGIGLGAAFITHVASYLIERRDKQMHGEKPFTGTGHILLVGYTSDTEYLAGQIREDESYREKDVVILADLARHPMPEEEGCFFVKGAPDTTQALERANVSKASRIVIHTGSDEISLFALINALKHKNDACEVTVRCLSSQSLDTFGSVPGRFETIMQMTAEMMVQAMQDRVHIPLQILLKNDANEEIYFVTIPDIGPNQTWWPLHNYLNERYGYLSFALRHPDGKVQVNPPAKTPVTSGCGIWLIALERPVTLEWPV